MRYNNCKSSISTIPCGAPQGSDVVPLLFIIYTNDLPNSPTSCKTILFADDIALYYQQLLLKVTYIINSNMCDNITIGEETIQRKDSQICRHVY